MSHYTNLNDWKNIKKDMDLGLDRKQICDKHQIGQKKYWRIKKSKTYQQYQKLTLDATRLRAKYKAKRQKELAKLDKICKNSKYDRKPYPTPDQIREKQHENGFLSRLARKIGLK